MPLKEAIEKKRKFKRPIHDSWLYVEAKGIYREVDNNLFPLDSTDDLCAEDWEIEEKTATVTESQIRDAIIKALSYAAMSSKSSKLVNAWQELVVKDLLEP
jgi:hypothetical protein